MPNTPPPGAPAAPALESVAEALEKNKAAADEVRKAADDLLVVRSVLKKEAGEPTQSEAVGQAIDQTGEIEKRLSDTADALDDVNASLAAEAEAQRRAADAGG